MRDFGDWFKKSAEQAGDALAGRTSDKPEAEGGQTITTAPVPPAPIVNGGGISDVELVTGTAGTGVRTGDEDKYDSFRPGGRDFGQPAKQGSGTGRGQDFETGFDMTL
ncbi:MAG: hypothetical protein KJ017_04415 [Alphaproteobacteria bacterium]|nr:hypothetical protein [Alphaproteobacteria bacterium]